MPCFHGIYKFLNIKELLSNRESQGSSWQEKDLQLLQETMERIQDLNRSMVREASI